MKNCVDIMEISSVRHQHILPDSTTAITNGKQDLNVLNNPMQVSAVTGDMDSTLTDLLLENDNNFFLNSNVEEFLSFQKTEVLDLTTSNQVLSAATDPTLLSSLLNNEDSNTVTSTSQDETFDQDSDKAKYGCIIILPQHPSSSMSPMQSVRKCDNNLYTLTLTDGSIVQLRVQNDVIQQQQPTRSVQDDLTNLENCCWLQNDGNVNCSHCVGRQQVDSPPATVGEEVILPLTDDSTQPKVDLLQPRDSLKKRESLSPVSPQEVMPMYTFSKTRASALKLPTDLFDLEECENQILDDPSQSSNLEDDDFSANDLSSIFASMDNVTIESLKARLCAGQPEGPTFDLVKLLEAAKINLTVNTIVSLPLTTLKKTMENSKLLEWQMALCLKIRRRKKNTAAVRSSRRKRNQYVVDLRHHVSELKKRKQELQVEQSLLEQLTSLWERLCSEVEAEIQEGVKRQLGFQSQENSLNKDDLSDAVIATSGAEIQDQRLENIQPRRETARTRRKYEMLSNEVKKGKNEVVQNGLDKPCGKYDPVFMVDEGDDHLQAPRARSTRTRVAKNNNRFKPYV